MQKDVIYIDTEDDITAIIGKVKAAGSKIVALVPPKRMGVLQSAVNLKLLTRAAESAQKRIVLITNDHSLIALAAGLHMPVAKNLQSKPEIPQMTAPEAADEEVIEGKDIPVGDFASSIGGLASALKKDKSVADEISEKVEIGEVAVEAASKPAAAKPNPLAALKKKSVVPNFTSFRNKLFLIGGGLIVLGVFLFWATAIAPSAKVVIAAKTTGVNVDRTLKLDTGLQASDAAGLKLKPIVQQIKKTVATEFDATGTKDIGNKASGTVTVRNCDIGDDFILPANTKFTGANSQVFYSTQAVTIPQFSGSASLCTQGGPTSGKASVPVQAADIGPDYNIGSQAYSVGGQSPDGVDGVGSEMSGGTRETVKVVSQADVDKAKTQLPTVEESAAKAELKKQFTSEQIIIEESYELTQGADAITPNIGEQASRAKITKETTLTYTGLARADVKTILDSVIADALKEKSNQQMYSTGEDTIKFQAYQKNDAGVSVRLITTASIGPKIDTKQLAKELEGKRFGEVQAHVSQISGVENVDILFSPFWVTNAPKADKIDIEFTVAQDDQ